MNPYPLEKGYIVARQKIEVIKKLAEMEQQDYLYLPPRKLSNIEKHNWKLWLDKEFPKEIEA